MSIIKKSNNLNKNNKKKLWWQIKNDFKCIRNFDPSFNSKFEYVFNHPGVWAIVVYRISNRIHDKGFSIIARMLSGLNQVFTNIDIHPACLIGNCVFIDHGIGVVIGQSAIVGDNVLIYQGVSLGGVSLNKGKRHPTIKNGCVIGAGAKILGNITIGENCKIGANSVVVKNVPPNCTAIGVPAIIVQNTKRSINQFNHHKLPDITKEAFLHLLKELNAIKQDLKDNNITLTHSNKQEKTHDSYHYLDDAKKACAKNDGQVRKKTYPKNIK